MNSLELKINYQTGTNDTKKLLVVRIALEGDLIILIRKKVVRHKMTYMWRLYEY